MEVGARGRAPGCGAGGLERALEVVVAGTEAGVVRVGGGLAVWGVMPSGFAATGAMGSFLWIGMGGIVVWWVVVLWSFGVCALMRGLVIESRRRTR